MTLLPATSPTEVNPTARKLSSSFRREFPSFGTDIGMFSQEYQPPYVLVPTWTSTYIGVVGNGVRRRLRSPHQTGQVDGEIALAGIFSYALTVGR